MQSRTKRLIMKQALSLNGGAFFIARVARPTRPDFFELHCLHP